MAAVGRGIRHGGIVQAGVTPRHATPTMRKSAVSGPRPTAPMDTEQINAIGTLLADLSARTQALRGYL